MHSREREGGCGMDGIKRMKEKKERRGEKNVQSFFYPQVKYRKPREAAWLMWNTADKPNVGQRRASSNSSFRKLLLLIFKGGFNLWGKKTSIKRLPWLLRKPYVQTTTLFARIKKGRIQLRLEFWPQWPKNQLQNSKIDKTYLNVKTHYI